jgi:SAM-dependent methyltransferase
MDPSLYPRMAEVEDAHWWFASRRAIVDRILDRLELPADAAILEPGCGTGGNFPMLARRGRLFAIDADQSAIGFARARGLAQIALGSLPDEIPFGDQLFDLVVMTDVLEHLDDQAGALRALRMRLRPGGWLLLTVPAMAWLWSDHDVTHHHRRRYGANELGSLVAAAGFDVTYLSYYNFLLFPVIAGARMLQRAKRPDRAAADGRHDLAMPPRAINSILQRVFSTERYLVGSARIPFGVSLIVIARALPAIGSTTAPVLSAGAH